MYLRFPRAILTLLILSVAATLPAMAQQRFALLIGNEAYSPRVGKLNNPTKDIQLISGALKDVGFKEDNIQIVPNAKLKDLLTSVTLFQQRIREAGPETIGFLYYSGHGIEVVPVV
jgi:uncharacterized caspase-like protein